IILTIALLVLSGCASKNQIEEPPEPTPEIVHESVDVEADLVDEEGNDFGDIDIHIEADVEMTTDCGDIACFEENFASCEQSTVTSKLTDDIIYYYEILGPKDNGCEVTSKFTANPNPEWVGKEMTCVYDNTLGFNDAIQDMSTCQGPLYTLMTGG
ncbi:MAG: hypothetical protein KKG59_05470, partial [Nanoarchaeota archaeon]|nr:hypothetical protein [Nanoarchaeota archaeon]